MNIYSNGIPYNFKNFSVRIEKSQKGQIILENDSRKVRIVLTNSGLDLQTIKGDRLEFFKSNRNRLNFDNLYHSIREKVLELSHMEEKGFELFTYCEETNDIVWNLITKKVIKIHQHSEKDNVYPDKNHFSFSLEEEDGHLTVLDGQGQVLNRRILTLLKEEELISSDLYCSTDLFEYF